MSAIRKTFSSDFFLIYVGSKKRFFYGSATVVSLATNVLFVVMQYYLWSAIYSTNQIEVIEFQSAFTYVVITQLIFSIYPTGVGEYVGEKMRSGDIIMLMIRPATIFRRVLLDSLGGSIFRVFAIALPTLFFSTIVFGTNFYWANFLQFISAFVLAYAFYFIFEMIIGCISFFTKSIWGIQSLKYALLLILSARMIPIALYPERLRAIIELLPFSNMFALLANILTGEQHLNAGNIINLVISIAVSYAVYLFVLHISRKFIAIQGG